MRTIWLVGDSTVTDNTAPFRGWGYCLPEVTAEDVRVRNLAESGCSSKSFLAEGCFEEARRDMRPGDLLLIQFGHNDEKDDEPRHTDPHTTFPETLRIYIEAARERGALTALVTPVSRRFFAGPTSVLYTHGEYAGAVRRLAEAEGLPLIELEFASRELYLALGEEGAAKLFVQLKPGEHPDFPDGHDDRTHFNEDGARAICGLVSADMRRNSVLKSFLKEETQT
ncbi:MAG: rhamnogalacturonan acetylesterase [Clostridia bacterium]|nr:rhamnogalacturonan acetylesterase [Clostridia bacterium]